MADLVRISSGNVNLSDHYPSARWDGESAALADRLRAGIAGEVRFDNGSRALYATDGSNYRQVPIGVVIPRTNEDVLATVTLCREFGAPLLARGGGTSLAGQCCNVAVVIDFSKYMNKILEINREQRWARVQPGVVLDDLRNAATQVGLTFGPDPATHSRCTLGGMIGNNSCGVHSVMSGRTSDNVNELDIVTYDGLRMTVGETNEAKLATIIRAGGARARIYERLRDLRNRYGELVKARYPKIPRRVSGYNLDELLPENNFNVARALVGSECTCVMLLEAKVRLVKNPAFRALVVLGYPSVYEAGDHIPELLRCNPIGCEGIDDRLVGSMRKKQMFPRNLDLLPQGNGWLLLEMGGDTQAEADGKARAMMDGIRGNPDAPTMRLYQDLGEAKMVWEVRESALGASSFVPGEREKWEGWEDAAVPPDKMGAYLREFRTLVERHGYHCSLYGHFGEGCVHTRIDFDLTSDTGIRNFHTFIEEAADLVVGYGGSISGEHGDGQARAELLPRMFGPELIGAFQQFKEIWDPQWKMNPGKVVKAYRADENLRLGVGYAPWEPRTHFRFPEDKGSFAEATLRCVGVGLCRRHEGKTMCPTYRVTMEEMHSTRGRAHLLFELMQGDVLKGGWRDQSVHEALDLCLACKGCKGDCPVDVDVATYKAEFLSHFYQGRLRPRHAYAFGHIDLWARLASMAPALVNLVTQTPGLSDLAKLAVGISRERRIPAFAPQTFTAWFREREARIHERKPALPKVILWPDTFNNHFSPNVLKAAVEVLEAAGYRVEIPRKKLCCGRPLYDFGMLDRAKRLILKTLDSLAEDIDAGTPIVGLEPSCVSVFRDEMVNLFPTERRAQLMREQIFMLSEFLEMKAPNFQIPPLRRKALVHGHCHQKAVMRMDAESAVLARVGLDYEMPQNGCCGLAGSFGFEKEKYDLSIAIAEQEIAPNVREARKETIIVANGFSCREQVSHTTDRKALHLAEVLQMALAVHSAPNAPAYPERAIYEQQEREVRRSMRRTAMGVAGVAAAAIVWWACRRK